MARQKGLIKVTGTLGEVNFYMVKGVGYARTAGGGFNGKAIRTKPSMQRVRENASEFGHCSSVKKAFRLALLPVFDPPKSSTLHRRMMGLFTQLKDLDGVSSRGQRRVAFGIETVKGKQVLKAFDFVPQQKVVDFVLNSSGFDWPSQTLTINSLDLNILKFPKGSSHLVMTLGILDFDFNNYHSTLHCSTSVFMEKGHVYSSFSLIPEIVALPKATGLAVLGLQFCEVLDGDVYPLKAMNALGCTVVSVL